MPKISIIIPCYYNEKNVEHTIQELINNEGNGPDELEFEYVFVDDGSKDNTWHELEKIKQQYQQKIVLIKLVANVGSYNAIVAGMKYATGDCNVVLAADLQDPPELIFEMYKHWQAGFKLVIGNRKDRQDPLISKYLAITFQYIIRKLALTNLPKGGFDYVLFDRELKDKVLTMEERNTNVLYLFIWMGYPYVNIPYVRKKREVGESRWTFSKKMKLLIDSFISFSYFPIRLISTLGLLLGLAALGYCAFVIVARLFGLVQVEGWTSLMIVLLFVSSFQMMALGVLGEYLWRVLDSNRKRPLYLISEIK